MSATETRQISGDPSVGQIDFKLDVQIIPVSDVERSKQFYQHIGWRLDSDVAPLDGLRIGARRAPAWFGPPEPVPAVSVPHRPDSVWSMSL
jgi:hypothetical protein